MSRKPHASRHEARPPKTRCGRMLDRWAAQPLAAVNRRSVMWTGLTMFLIISVSRHEPLQAVIVRNVAFIMMGIHGLLHVLLLGLLDWLRDKGVPEAESARGAYLAPRRISNLDLAVSWALLVAAVSLFRAVFPVAVPG